MSRSRRQPWLVAIVIAALVAWSLGAHAEPNSDSPLLNGLNKILQDPNKKLAFTPGKTAVVFLSERGEASFGADCRVRLHDPGTLKRMMDLTKGFDADLGQALGHKERKDPSAVSCMAKLVTDQGLNWRLRPNQMGFGGTAYSPKTRPLDIWCGSMKATVAPNGQCTINKIQRGPLGFGNFKPTSITKGGSFSEAAQVVSPPQPLPRRAMPRGAPMLRKGGGRARRVR